MLNVEHLKLDINVPAKMRDGVTLYADVWRPEDDGKYPAVLNRLPYNKNLAFPTRAGYMNPQRLARAGYAVVIQDVRGTGVSEDEPYFWHQETNDGYDSVEWVASQPWCNGSVGMYGFSYYGYTQWAAAAAQPPHLKTICPGLTQVASHSFPFTNTGNIFRLNAHLGWCLMMTTLSLLRRKLPPQDLKSLAEYLIYLTDNIKDQFLILPLKDCPAVRKIDEMGMMPLFADILAHLDDADYWQRVNGPLPLEKITIPIFHLAGWYDLDMTPGVLESYQELNRIGDSQGNRKAQQMVIGPWIHSSDMLNKVGELDFGQAASGAIADVAGMHIRWFDRWLKGIDNGISNEPPIKIFVMGNNIWREEKEWPLDRTQYKEFYFHSGGKANSRSGDGQLSTVSPDDEPYDNFLYDPRNPVPSNEMGAGAWDQREVENRNDILVYTTQPLGTDLEVTGPVSITLWAESSAQDTDFSGKLVDVWPNGKAYNILEGIIRARYRNSSNKAEPIQPGTAYQYSIDMGATSNVFKAGHCIRIEISSSNFPKWDRNLNTGNPAGQDAEMKVTLQTVLHSRQYASHITLPVID